MTTQAITDCPSWCTEHHEMERGSHDRAHYRPVAVGECVVEIEQTTDAPSAMTPYGDVEPIITVPEDYQWLDASAARDLASALTRAADLIEVSGSSTRR